MKNEELIRKWLTDQLSEEEEKLLKETEEYADLKKIWDGLSLAKPPALNVDEELKRFHHSRRKETKVIKLTRQQKWIGIAASLILVSIIGFFTFTSSFENNEIILSEEMKSFYLPDSSSVILNKDSKLVYKGSDWSSNRKVSLEGEGFFKVKPGSTFEVVTSSGTVTVLGTSFNVKQRKGYYEVICFEGKVKVAVQSESQKLLANDGFRYYNGKGYAFKQELGSNPEWLDGRSSFFRTPLIVVIAELENQYNIKIVTKNVDLENTFTGSFPNDNMGAALKSITLPSGYSFLKEDSKVIITGEEK